MTENGENKKQPVNKIQGWGVMPVYVDDELNVFKKGRYVGTTAELREQGEEIEDVPSATRLGKESKSTDDEVSILRKALESNAKLAEMVQELIKAQGQSKETEKLAQTLLEFQAQSTGQPMKYGTNAIDPEDLLSKEDAVTYYSPSWMYLIYDYHNAAGVPMKNPYNKIITFKYQGSRKVKDQDEERWRAFCTYTSRSKKEVKWLEDHPMYNLAFFRKSNKAFNTNSMIVTRSAEIYKRISSWDKATIIEEANKEGITFDPRDGLEPVIKALAQVKVLQVIEEEQKVLHEKQKSVILESMINNK